VTLAAGALDDLAAGAVGQDGRRLAATRDRDEREH
jgi:hypothetical protein